MKKHVLSVYLLLVVILLGGCATVDRGNFGPFKRSLNNTSYGYNIIKDFTGTAPTEYIEVFDVRPGDCASDTGWSDCKQDRERSELSGSKDNYPGNEFLW